MAYLKRMLQSNGRSYASMAASNARVILCEHKRPRRLSRLLQASLANWRLRHFGGFDQLLNHTGGSGELQ